MLSPAILASILLAASAHAVRVTCNIQTCGDGRCGYGVSRSTISATVDGQYSETNKYGTCALETLPDCSGTQLDNGVKIYTCTDNILDIAAGSYCEYQGTRINLDTRDSAKTNCENTFAQGGPYYDDYQAFQYHGYADI
jgi:hypothetical protein